jgi:tetratricopeptide (TPR) repeat protein
MRERAQLLAALLPFVLGVDLLSSSNRAVEEGNGRMKAGKAEEALVHYDKAVAKLPSEPGAHFNRGTALYGLSRFDEASREFLRATEARNPALKASAFYNLGNAFFQSNKFQDAAEAFKKSLAYNPGDVRAKWNLELALKKKKEEEDKKKDEKNKDDKDKDKNKKDDKQDKQDKKDQDKKDDKQDKQDKKDQDKKDDKQKTEQDKQQEKEKQAQEKQAQEKQAQQAKADQKEAPADMKEIDAILDSLERSPKALEQERARIRAVRRQPPEKDW